MYLQLYIYTKYTYICKHICIYTRPLKFLIPCPCLYLLAFQFQYLYVCIYISICVYVIKLNKSSIYIGIFLHVYLSLHLWPIRSMPMSTCTSIISMSVSTYCIHCVFLSLCALYLKLHVYMCIYILICICILIHICSYLHLYPNLYLHLCLNLFLTFRISCIHTHIRARLATVNQRRHESMKHHISVCTYVLHLYIYIYVHTYTCAQSSWTWLGIWAVCLSGWHLWHSVMQRSRYEHIYIGSFIDR